MLYGWKENSMLTNCLAECAHLTMTVSEIERDIGRKSSILHTPLHSTTPLEGFPSEYRHPVRYGKTRMVCYPMVKKFRRYLYSFWRNSRTWRTHRQTDGHRVTAYTVLMHMHRAVKTIHALLEWFSGKIRRAEHSVGTELVNSKHKLFKMP